MYDRRVVSVVPSIHKRTKKLRATLSCRRARVRKCSGSTHEHDTETRSDAYEEVTRDY